MSTDTTPGTLAIDTTGTPPPGVKVHYLPDGRLVVGIYPTERRGTVYRWDNGLDELPSVICWDLDGPPCQ